MMLEAKLISAGMKKNLFYWLSFLVGLLGPIAVIARRFNLIQDRQSGTTLTFLGLLVALVLVNFFRKEIMKWIESWPISLAKSIILTIVDTKWWLALLMVLLLFRSEYFYSFIEDWYTVAWFSFVLSLTGGFLKRMHEYYLEYISDRRKYLKFKEWDKE
jgi:hypothetical protein